MCGILGFASNEPFHARGFKQRFLTTGFPLLAIDRGMESSGLALVEKLDEDPIIYKKALCGWDFIQQFQTQKHINDIEKYQVVMGHVRASTKGNVNDHNSHPFQYGHITLVHNGHIRNAGQLKDADKAECSVDSAMVAYSMANNGELETLKSIEGGFVFIWWNSETKKLNIARNEDRPLFMAYTKKENSLYWASELTQLLHLMRSTEIDEDFGHMYPGAMIWYQYDLKDLRSPEKIPFVKSQGRQIVSIHGVHGPKTGTGETIHPYNGWTDQELEAWALHGNTTPENSTTKDSTRQLTTISDQEEIDSIRESLRNQRRKDAKQSGIPTSPKRIHKAKQELKKLGLEFQQLKVCYPISWHLYRNQRGYGSMMCRIRGDGGHLVEVINVRETEYPIFLNTRIVLVDCCNVRRGADGLLRVIGTISSKMQSRLERIRDLEKKSKENNKEDTKQALGSIERDYDGPGGQKVTRARFLELSVGGCANCQRDIDPKSHGTLIWVGTPASPICHSCQTPGILESIGFPDHLKVSSIH